MQHVRSDPLGYRLPGCFSLSLSSDIRLAMLRFGPRVAFQHAAEISMDISFDPPKSPSCLSLIPLQSILLLAFKKDCGRHNTDVVLQLHTR